MQLLMLIALLLVLFFVLTKAVSFLFFLALAVFVIYATIRIFRHFD